MVAEAQQVGAAAEAAAVQVDTGRDGHVQDVGVLGKRGFRQEGNRVAVLVHCRQGDGSSGTVVLDKAGIFTEHDVQTLTSYSIDCVAGEPTHTALADVGGIAGIVDIGCYGSLLNGASQFVNRKMPTHLETTCIAF